jgi:nucleoside-diphosphate-sugar epimerase
MKNEKGISIMHKRLLITGHKGYIGSVMAPLFVQAGYDVVGLDTGYFDRCTLVPDEVQVPTIRKDIRDVAPDDLHAFNAVIHLAALSNDPIGNLDQGWTRQINCEATVRLAEFAKAAGVERFLFSSSCIMYGMSEANVVTEESPLDPRTEYARSKVLAEKAISNLAGDGFSPTFLRNGTVYGLSPRMRFDTVLNDLVGTAVATGKVVVTSDGKPWRPVVHVQDVARAFMTVLKAPLEQVHNQAFNTGANELNHQILDLAEIAARTVPGCKLELKAQTGADQRTYKADFGKFARTFPDFKFTWSAEKGAAELYRAFHGIRLTHADLVDKKFTRLKWLTHLIESRQLDENLHWRSSAGTEAFGSAGESL